MPALDAVRTVQALPAHWVGLCDCHTHTSRCGHAVGTDEAFVQAAIDRGLAAIAITDHLPFYWLPSERHDPFLAMASSELPRYVETVLDLKDRYRGQIEVLLGIEADFVVGCEDVLREELVRHPFDVVLGSVHWIDGWWVDAPSSVERYSRGQDVVDTIWKHYCDNLARAASCGLFDVLAHLDLPKKFGFRPSRPFGGRLQEIVAAVRDGGCAVEVSSAGRRRPVGEAYPAADVLRALSAAGVPVVLSSDAHSPAEVGFAFEDLVGDLAAAGVRETLVFRRRRGIAVALPPAC
jgi:histidinol-phosphatase (PHP family)